MLEDQNRSAEDEPVIITETEAKQGVELHRMRHVLWISTAGAAVVLGLFALTYA